MEKTKISQVKEILFLLPVGLVLSIFAACNPDNGFLSQPGDNANDSGSALRIVAIKQPFTDENGTRAGTDLGGTYTTPFTNGDQIGITAVKDGAVVEDCNNVPLTYNATTGAWEGNDIFYLEGVTYIAYSPYRVGTMDSKKSTQEIYDAFSISKSQLQASAFASSDLMTSTACTANKTAKTLTITFEHRMAMLEIDALYGYTADGWAYPIKNSEWGSVIIDGVTVINGFFRNSAEGTNAPFRCLFKPFTDKSFSLIYYINSGDNSSLKSGTWNTSQKQTFIAGQRRKITPQKRREIVVGDYYYSDGSIFPSNMNITPVPDKNKGCIGVVFALGATGISKGDDISYYSDSGLKGTIHGYVAAVGDAAEGNYYIWCDKSNVSLSAGTSTDKSDYKGYYNTKMIKEGPLTYSESGTPACWYATHYPVAAPSNTSGWFLPSAAQGRQTMALLNNIAAVGGTQLLTIWTSTEYSINRVYMIRQSYIENTPKELSQMSVRSILTF